MVNSKKLYKNLKKEKYLLSEFNLEANNHFQPIKKTSSISIEEDN